MAYNYPYGNGQQLNLDWFLNEWKNLLAAWEAEKNGIEGALQAEIDKAEAALADVFAARDAAAQSAANADASKSAAAQSASDASGYLATVRADANTAHNAAQNAAQSESNAADSAQTALASKSAAGQSERNAAQSEANANSSKNAAAQSASDADASKSAAAKSAEDADASKNAAAQSASDAEDAASSIEASTQQIATNASDISNLKESFIYNNLIPETKNELDSNGVHIIYENGIFSFEGTYNAASGGRLEKIVQNFKLPAGSYIFNGVVSGAGSFPDLYLQNASGNSIIALFSVAGTAFTLEDETTVFIGANFVKDRVYSTKAFCQISIGTEAKTPMPSTGSANDYITRGLLCRQIPNMYADKLLIVNDFVIVQEKLYKVTQNIAAYAQLIVGTNVQETTIAEIITSILNS